MDSAKKCPCGKSAIYIRRCEGRAYCKECFLHQIEKQFKRAVRKYAFLNKSEHIAVALSGGKDSSALLYLLNDLAKSMRLKLSAVTIDEGIRKYRPDTIKEAKKLCKKLGVGHHIISFKKEFGINLDEIPKHLTNELPWCSWCGVLRRRALNNAARKLGCVKLAVGHNLDDEVQSVFMGIVRGDFGQFSRLGATTAESADWVPRIKPLREIAEKEITLYAFLRGLPFSSIECPYSVNMMRRRIGEFINDLELDHPGTKHQILKFHGRVQSKMSNNSKVCVAACKACGEPSSGEECRVCSLLKQLKR